MSRDAVLDERLAEIWVVRGLVVLNAISYSVFHNKNNNADEGDGN